MPTYEITGIVKSTGKDRKFRLDARDEDQAHVLASDCDVMVATCELIAEASETEKRSSKTDPFANYASKRCSKTALPAYGVLETIGFIYTVVGVLVMIAALILLAIAVDNTTGPPELNYLGREIDRQFSFLDAIPAFTTAITGLLILGVGQATFAFRDIARNSWRSANAAEA